MLNVKIIQFEQVSLHKLSGLAFSIYADCFTLRQKHIQDNAHKFIHQIHIFRMCNLKPRIVYILVDQTKSFLYVLLTRRDMIITTIIFIIIIIITFPIFYKLIFYF